VATKDEVTRALERLMARLDDNDGAVRSAIPERKVFRCHVPDLDASWFSVIEDGHVSPPVESRVPDNVDVTLEVDSDDLIELVEERTSFVSSFLSGKVRVHASMIDLLRLRTLL
jgi:SCP-2 sterol transfer family